MNPTLLHSPYSMNYAVNGDFKYSATSDRPYSNSHFTANELVDRKNGLSNNSFNQSLSLGAGHGTIDYSTTHLPHEPPCNPSSHMLTPPHSGDETVSSINNPPSTSFSFSSIPKVCGSNATGPEYYATPGSSFLHSSFNGASMTTLGRRDPLQMPAPLSPPYNYGQVNSGSFPPAFSMTRPVDFHYSGPRNSTDSTFRRPHLFQPFPHSSGTITSLPNPLSNPPNRPEGPPFDETHKVHSLVNSHGQNISVEIVASIPKGFFKVEDKWTCYRRNYFSVSCGFTFKTHNLDSQVFLQRYLHSPGEQISAYAVSITAKTAAANNTESEARGLVQHTPKRDKATESIPTRHTVVPSLPHVSGTSHRLSTAGLFSTTSHLGTCLPGNLDHFSHPAAQPPQTNYIFERIQFQKATANNGKRRAQQQYFHVVVKLEANVGRPGGPEEWVVIATKQSHPMVVRGRSPGHYKDNRRDSQTSLDPDGGSGQGGDGHLNYPMHSIGTGHAALGSSHAQYRHGHPFGTPYTNTTHAVHESDSVTSSPASSTMNSSPLKSDDYQRPCSVMRGSVPDANRNMLSPILKKSGREMVDFTHSRKRVFEDDSSDCANPFFSNSLDSTYQNPAFDFSATSATQALCASS